MASAPVTDGRVAADRAAACLRAVVADRLHDPRRHLFGLRGPLGWTRWTSRRRYEALWPFANAWSACCTLAATGHGPACSVLPGFLLGLGAYDRRHQDGPAQSDQDGPARPGTGPVGYECVVVPPLGTGGEVFFDDNAWLGLALLRHAGVTGDERALGTACRLFGFVASGWSSDPSWAHPGGVRWKAPASCVSRNACSTGPAAELAVLVHEHTGDGAALEWSMRAYRWARAALLGDDGLYLDRIAPDGSVARDVWSYNQGTMIGAGVLLHRATGDRAYLGAAAATADATMNAFDVARLLHPNGPAFNAGLFRNLLLLDEVRPDPRYRSLAATYGDVMWEEHRDARTGLFSGGRSPLNATAPMLQIYALLAGAPPHA